MSDIVQSAIIRLVRSQPFYGSVLLNLVRERGAAERRNIPTAAVYVRRDGTIGLAVNVEFFESLSPTEQEAVLVHECLHVVHLHLQRGPKDFDDPRLANIAMDLVINQYIQGLPELAVTLSSFPDLNLPAEMTADYYYDRLRDEVDRIKQLIEDGKIVIVDEHDGWGETDVGLPRPLVEAACRGVLADASQRTKDANQWGSVPAGIRRAVEAALTSQVDWRRELRRFVGERIRIDTTSTRKRRHRRFGWDFPGKKPVRGARLLVAVDTSGSVDQGQLSQFLAEIDEIAAKAEILIAEVDAVVQQVYEYKPKRTEVEFRGGGGTSFQILWDAIENRQFPEFRTPIDGIIYFTDGWAEWPKNDGGIPTIWVVTDAGRANAVPWGRSVYLPVERR